MILYHGTHIQGLELLKPFATRGNAISKAVVCLTPNPHISLFYIWSRPYKWVAFDEDPNGRVVFTEQYDGMLFDFYNNISGSIYECDGSNPQIQQTHMEGVYTSEFPINIEKETVILNVFPQEWEIASKMSQQEIDEMIKEWKASLQSK